MNRKLAPLEAVALSNEIDAASSLLRHGFSILGRYRFASRDAEPLFACFAGGVEKLLKLTVGLLAFDQCEAWPDKATMKAAGHRIVELDRSVRRAMERNMSRSTAPGLIRQLLEATDGHPGVTLMLTTLERYAVNGRFYNLDLLGGLEHHDGSPRELWDELEMLIIEANPEMLDDLATEAHDEARTQMNGIIARSMGLWCELEYRAWVTGVCGSLAQQWSPQLELGHARPRIG